MKRTKAGNIKSTNKGFPQHFHHAFFTDNTAKRGYLSAVSIMSVLFSSAQSVSPAIINVTGQSANSGNYQFEWSIGESAAITTMTSSNLIVTSGLLQSIVPYRPIPNTSNNFLPDEIKIYPNPTRNIIEINILHAIAGKNKLELFDIQGRKMMEKEFEYYGGGRVEKWDLSRLAAGLYFLHIQLLHPVSGQALKKGAFRIIKIQ